MKKSILFLFVALLALAVAAPALAASGQPTFMPAIYADG